MENKILKELMTIDPANLAQKQHVALKAHAISVLKAVIEAIEKNQYGKIEDMCEYSPAGDGMGCENHYINFAFDGAELDILELVHMLKGLDQNL